MLNSPYSASVTYLNDKTVFMTGQTSLAQATFFNAEDAETLKQIRLRRIDDPSSGWEGPRPDVNFHLSSWVLPWGERELVLCYTDHMRRSFLVAVKYDEDQGNWCLIKASGMY